MGFRELLCFPFTVTDKDPKKGKRGLFLGGQNKRKRENDRDFFKSRGRDKSQEKEITDIIFVSLN